MNNIIHVNFKTGETQTDAEKHKLFLQMLSQIPLEAEMKRPWLTKDRFEIGILILSIIASVGLGVCLHSMFT